MHAAILGARPPILYWLPATVAVIHGCAALRADGIGAWETIDAGPQVKILCLAADAEKVGRRLEELVPGIQTIVCHPGPGLTWCEPGRGLTARLRSRSILLLGEYAVLEKGGLGLAMAVERRVRIDIFPSEELSIEGVVAGRRLILDVPTPLCQPTDRRGRRRGGEVAAEQARRARTQERAHPRGLLRSLRSDGRKSGLGSSAAVTAGLVCALLDAAGCRGATRWTCRSSRSPLGPIAGHREEREAGMT